MDVARWLRTVRGVILAIAVSCTLVSSFAQEKKTAEQNHTLPLDKVGLAQEVSVPVGNSTEGIAPKSLRSVDLLPLDFRRLSALRSRDGGQYLTVDFLDEDRLLATFEGNGVVRRIRSCPRDHDDRIVHAIVLDVHSGAVLRRAEWYLHDRRQYLWPLASGQMLLRRGESLLLLDRDLNEKPLPEQPGLVWVGVIPDGKQLALEVELDKKSTKDGEKSKTPKYEVRFLDVATLSVWRTLHVDRAVPLKATGDGYADVVLKNGWTWLVRFGASGQPRQPITRVRSSCIPDLEISGGKTLLVGRCTTAQGRYVMSSFTTGGQFLWRQRWSEPTGTPIVTRSLSGARFALSRLAVVRGNAPAGNGEENKRTDERVQRIEVFNSTTGTSVLALETQPAVTVGGNVALSPEGVTLALLRDGHLELYELPELGKEEAEKFAAVRAGTPGIIAPIPANDAAEDAELAADDEGTAQPALATGANPSAGSAAGHDAPGALQTGPSVAGTLKGQGADSPVAVFRSGAEVVVVDVVVTDSKGSPVAGLKPEAFRMSEDGKRQTPSSFEEHSVGSARQTPTQEFSRPANIFSNIRNTTQPDSATLILFDMLNTSVQDQARARDALMRYIKRKPRNESFALCVLAGPLRLIRGFTTDENELLLGMRDERAKPRAPLISQLDASSLAFIRSVTQKLDTPNDINRTFAIAMAGLERSIQDEQFSQDDMRTYITIGAFGELARYMAGVPGRKKVLWLSAAFPLGAFASTDGLDAGPFHQQRNFLPLVRQTMNLLASAHVSVYPVDVRGVTTNSVADIAEATPFSQNLPNSPLTGPSGMGQQNQAGGSGLDANAASAARNMANDHAVSVDGFVQRGAEDSARRNSEHTAMDLVAEETGGKAFYGSNDITDALRTTIAQSSDYYTLSYTPTNRNYDGRFRKIHVEVAGHGYRLAHRSGYFAEDPNRRPAKSEEVLRSMSVSGMMHGSPESRQIPLQVRIVPLGEPRNVNAAESGIHMEAKSEAATGKLQRYAVDYAISAAPLRFDPGPDGNAQGRFRLLSNSFDREGQPLLHAASTLAADLKPANYQKIFSEGLRFRQELEVPVQASFLRLGVIDLSSNSIGTLELPLPVSAAKDGPVTRPDKAMPPVEPE